MTGQDFLEWTKVCKIRFAAQIADTLSVNRNLAQEWLTLAEQGQSVPVKRTVALAMSAIAQGLKPWDEYHR